MSWKQEDRRKAEEATLCVRLTLPSATTDLPEAGSFTQPVEPLLFDQLHDLGLDLLSQLPAGNKINKTKQTQTCR